ncbi:SPOR domain-containing protein [Tatumella citrea]|uniref:SPOR domain-containing protein n=1 Tax=Tatumella citrea TaxID=53336 RepID=A0A1Y0L9W2_TATCI|nr:SPOR domain-containing protein [Tatumella citrea]ARU94727.1 hypothetical protein A7K98_13765 [Tatumella citrea]ARU98765.1 hypothetical protein A7K99_13750 [Tatumella citrea]
MASKFQNRLVGTVILVAIGVIVLPGLLDGKKKHYKEEFAAIPLVPKPGDQQDNDLVPPVTQPLTGHAATAPGTATTPPGGEDTDSDTIGNSGNSTSQSPQQTGSNVQSQSQQTQQQQQQQAQNDAAERQQEAARQKQAQLARQQAEREASQAQAQARAERQASEAAAKAKAKQAQAEKERQRALQALNDQSAAQPSAPATETKADAPTGQAYVIQLGALKNAAKATEIVTELRASGFRAYSVPATPVQGQINRILVGPDNSKSHLQSQIEQLKSKTGLSGVVRPYAVR